MTPEEYLGRVRAIAWRAADYVPAGSLEFANQLIDHGEPAEGLRSLAWVIVNAEARIPRDLIEGIYWGTHELIDEKDMPSNLEDYALD